MDIASLDLVWSIVGGLFIVFGIIGCFLPIVPGPPFAYVGLLLLQLWQSPPFSTNFLLIWLAVTVLVTVLDYIIPVYGAKKFGGSKMGAYGSTVGLIVGLFFPPVGIILGPVIGAIVGELLVGKEYKEALKSGFGSFLGFLAGTLLKLVASCMMGYYFIVAMFEA